MDFKWSWFLGQNAAVHILPHKAMGIPYTSTRMKPTGKVLLSSNAYVEKKIHTEKIVQKQHLDFSVLPHCSVPFTWTSEGLAHNRCWINICWMDETTWEQLRGECSALSSEARETTGKANKTRNQSHLEVRTGSSQRAPMGAMRISFRAWPPWLAVQLISSQFNQMTLFARTPFMSGLGAYIISLCFLGDNVCLWHNDNERKCFTINLRKTMQGGRT